jgi:chromosome segregation protein
MHFIRLRLAGFKSFVEPAELLIEPGMTGIIGPNGCGKSNLVEALRWVMGEASAKKMRGDGMDDVIFNGSGNRPPRNITEVSLRLDNSDRSAPAAFNDSDELEVVRRIERESGSNYAINGSEARAKDVQLMFADLSTGAHSTALVSQGQIGLLVQAKPAARRALIEEAAGITGLHSRRHEAELRLKAAETNLERLADVVETMEGQHRGLKRQARQASRYSNLSRHIRTAEARLFLRLWTDALAEAEAAEAALAGATQAVGKSTALSAQMSSAQLKIQKKVPPLRESEAEAAARLHRLIMERENLDRDEVRANAAATSLQDRTRQITADQAREKEHASQSEAKVTELNQEQADQEAAKANEAPALEKSTSDLAEATRGLSEGEGKMDALSDALTSAETGRASLAAEIDQAARRADEIERRMAATKTEQNDMGALGAAAAGGDSAVAVLTAVQTHATAMTKAQGKAEDALATSQATEAATRDAFNTVQSHYTRVTAEAYALNKVFGDKPGDDWPAIVDGMSVQPGYETALGAALGDDLSGSSDTSAPVHWTTVELDRRPPLPAGCQPLSDFVKAPKAAQARLSQIGVVDEGQGEALRPSLAQGQRLVTKPGGLWRWDGFTSVAGASTAAAMRLEQRNRLESLSDDAAKAQTELEDGSNALQAATDQTRAALEHRDGARVAATQANTALAETRDAQTEAIRGAAARAERAAALVETQASLQREATDVAQRRDVAVAALAKLPDADGLRTQVQDAREQLSALRGAHREAQAVHQQVAAQAEIRAKRLAEIGPERASWSEQAASATRHLVELSSRLASTQSELKILEARPAEITEMRQSLVSRTEQAEAERTMAADNLAQAETALAAQDRLAKQANQAQAMAREEMVRAESRGTQAGVRRQDLAERIAERLESHPDGLEALANLKENEAVPESGEIEARLEKLKRERDTMGPVNLRAEVEADELAEQLAALATEREDLEGAIHRLRQGISSLNREGRQRMRAAFETVDGHFQKLFVRLFEGGEAHLAMVESDDPLEAGLEIMATLPGKRQQTLSLLSGGEQALTAIALRFAVFMTNPAPICVMDEVDAPLDDTNVERFCGLVDEIAHIGQTRFLVITHHSTTMARMDRLYGVTMSERGVSQLVSVDLDRAENMREAS